MSLWGSIKHAVSKAASVVVDTVSDNLEAAAGAVAAPIQDVGHEIEHVAKGVIKTIQGDRKGAAEEFDKAKDAAREIGGDILGAVPKVALIVGVNYVSAVQRIIGVEGESRRLTDKEHKSLEPIFRDSVDYDAVEITEGNLGLLGSTNSVFTLCHKIRVASGSGFVPLEQHRHVLVHEMVHVWQFEAGGPDYVAESLAAQATGDDGYWLDDKGTPVAAPKGYAFDVAVAGGEHWSDFNPEQQATFIEVAFQLGVDFANPDSTPMIFRGVDYTAELKLALAAIRAREGTP
ncbi:MAG TPA: hypothetical protein VGH98_18350 [Gemmatimonadaceae bacterium]|jgi:hypothetical protein